MARKKKDPTRVLPELDANRHHDTRKNIPTEELRDFVAEDESKPPKMLYPRDPSIDPQLVWKGKDEQDREPLEVDIVPIYIQEVIEPRVIIDAVQSQKRTKHETSGFLPGFFDDFDALDFDRKIEFYQHAQKWANRMIMGSSLHVMTSLAEKEGLKGKVQMIYIDPPYGIKLGSNWQVSTRKRDVKDGKAEDATRQPEQVRAFRDSWKLGIHSYLAVLRDWLLVARGLLTETGSVMLQIGDENVHLVRCLMDEVLGGENFCGIIIYQKTGGFNPSLLPLNVDFIIWYAKNKEQVKYRQLYDSTAVTSDDTVFLDFLELENGNRRSLSREEKFNPSSIPQGAKLFSRNPLTSDGHIPSLAYDYAFDNTTFRPPANAHWKTTQEGMSTLNKAKRLIVKGNTLRFVRFLN